MEDAEDWVKDDKAIDGRDGCEGEAITDIHEPGKPKHEFLLGFADMFDI
jgi:hypothetical protein